MVYDQGMNTHDESGQEDQTNNESVNGSGDGSGDAGGEPQVRTGATLSTGSRVLKLDEARAFAIRSAQSLVDDKCSDVVVIDVTDMSPVTGFIVVGSGTSARPMKSALEQLEEIAEESGTQAYHITTDNDSIWLLADFVDVVVHLFEPNARAHYDLEGLWFAGERLEVPASERSKTVPGQNTNRHTIIKKDAGDADGGAAV